MFRQSIAIGSILALFGMLTFVACSPPDDPNDDTGTTDGATTGADTDNGTDTTADTNGGDGTTDTSEPNDSSMGGDADAGNQCPRANDEKPHAGGTPTTSLPTTDANLQQVLDKIKSIKSNNGGSWPTNNNDREKNVSLTGSEKITVSGAVVTSTSYRTENFDRGQQVFWLQDSKAAIQTFLDSALQCPPNPIVRVGDRVEFTVTAVKLFGGTPEITQIEGFKRLQTSTDTVPYKKLTGKAITQNHVGQIGKVGGELTAIDQKPCGCPNVCYEMTHDGQTDIFRVPGELPEGKTCDDENVTITNPYPIGTCITYVGPIGSFPGRFADAQNKTIQLNASNFDWFFRDSNNNADAGSGGNCEPAEFFTGQIFKPESRSN